MADQKTKPNLQHFMDFITLPMAEVSLKAEITLPDFVERDLKPGAVCYRLVFTSKSALWLARTRDGSDDPVVAMLPLDAVALLRLYPTQGNCGRGGS